MTAKVAKKKAKKRKPVLGTVDRILNRSKLPDPRTQGRRLFCVEPVYAIQMDKAFQFINDKGRVRGRKGDFLLCRGDRLWKEAKDGFMSRHTMVDDGIPQAPYAGTAGMPLMDCDDIFAWYRFEEGRWVRGDRFTTVDWLIGIAAIIAILFVGTALIRALPDAYFWWRTYIG